MSSSEHDAAVHVRLYSTGVSINTDGSSTISIDESASSLLVVKGQQVVSRNLLQPEEPAQVTHIGEGPPAVALAASLDGSTLALQRSAGQVQVVQQSGPARLFVLAPQSRSHLLGFFWTRSSDGNFVMVTRTGWEIYRLDAGKQTLVPSDSHAHPVFWWRYSHAARLLLLGTGDIGLWLQAYQFTEEGATVKLPPFQIGASTPAGTPSPPASSRLNPSDVWVLVLYGGVYCAYLDRRMRKLHLHRFYADTVLPQQVYSMPGTSMALSVIDNLIVAHHLRTGVALVIDVCATSNPLAPPLPVGISAQASKAATDRSAWRYHLPNYVLDSSSGEVWRCCVEVAQLVVSLGSDPRAAVGFLVRRHPSSHPSLDLTALIVDTVRAALVERLPLPRLRGVLDELHAASASKPAQPAAVSSEVIVERVWGWLHSEEALDAPNLQAAVAEYAASLATHNLSHPPSLQPLLLDIALQQGHGPQASAAIAAQLSMASAALAQHVASPAGAGLPDAPALSQRLHLCSSSSSSSSLSSTCRSLLARGQVVQAARLAQTHRLTDPLPQDIVTAAVSSGDMHVILSVLRAYKEVISLAGQQSAPRNWQAVLHPVFDQLPSALQQFLQPHAGVAGRLG